MAQLSETADLTGLAETPNPSDSQDRDLVSDTGPPPQNDESINFRPTRIAWPDRPEFYAAPMTLEHYHWEYSRKRGLPVLPESDTSLAMTTATGDNAELPDAANTGPNHDGDPPQDGQLRRWIRYVDPYPLGPEMYAAPDDWEGPPAQHFWFGGHRAGDFADVSRSSLRATSMTSRLATEIESACTARLAPKIWP
jgi:hypothetical protein